MEEIKYYIIVKNEGSSESWEEEIEDFHLIKRPKTDKEAVMLGKMIITNFNLTLRHYETPRELLKIKKAKINYSFLEVDTDDD